MSEEKPIKLRVFQTFEKVKDFARDERGDVILSSLPGPDRVQAHEQFVRERLIATEETKLLRERVRWCYRTEGVNHLENCKEHVAAYLDRVDRPYWGMLKAPSTHY